MESYKQPWADELARLKQDENAGIIVGVEISKPKPWPPAEKILQLYNDGVDVKTISKEVGYSIPTVERNIKTQGVDPRVGEQCNKHTGKVYSLSEALSEMPIPCGPKCICFWRAVLKSDIGSE